jgi:hypothetical protein
MRVSFHRLLPREIVKGEGIPLKRAPVCETRQIKLKTCKQWLVLHFTNDYLQY